MLFRKRGLLGTAAGRIVSYKHVGMIQARTALPIGIVSFNLPTIILAPHIVLEGIDMRLASGAWAGRWRGADGAAHGAPHGAAASKGAD